MKILLTGAFGFIGSHLYDKLKYSNKVFRLGRTIKSDLDIDLTGRDTSMFLGEWLAKEKPDLIYHLAANATTYGGNYVWQRNVDMTCNLLRAMTEAKSEARLIYASSATVYSNRVLSTSYASEADPIEPESPYGASKAAGELFVRTFAKTEQIKPACILRLVATVGSRAGHGIVPDIIKKVRDSKDGKITLIGQQPGSSKPFIHVSDVVQAFHYFGIKQLNTTTNITYNISNVDTLTAEDVGEIIVDEMKVPRFIGFGAEGWAGDNNKVRVSNTFARMAGWTPMYNSHEAVRQAVKDILSEEAK